MSEDTMRSIEFREEVEVSIEDLEAWIMAMIQLSVADVEVSDGESPAVESLAAETSAPNTGKAKKTVKAKKVVTAEKPKNAPLHPPYEEMIKDAITKFIEEKQTSLPPNMKLLLYNLKKLVSEGKIVKVKSSFKFPAVRSAATEAEAAEKAEAPPSKASRTSSRTSPGKGAATKPVPKKSPVKAKAVKSPAKKGKK